MGETTREVEHAIKILTLTGDDIILLGHVKGKIVFDNCLNYFVKSGDRKWWWEDFAHDCFYFKESDRGFENLNEILPDAEEKVWFIIEDDSEPFYPVYDARAGVIKDIIANCFAFEYYIVNKENNWLLCENHHNTFIGVGDALRLKNIKRLSS